MTDSINTHLRLEIPPHTTQICNLKIYCRSVGSQYYENIDLHSIKKLCDEGHTKVMCYIFI